MTYTRMLQATTKLISRAMKSGRLLTLALITTFTSLAMQPAAQAQSSDTWKSVAIIGGSTVVGAYVGHKVAGPTGAWIGAAAGASTGYEIDRRRRANEYSQYGYDGAPYGNNGPYNGNGGYNGGYNGGPNDGGPYPYPAGYQSNNFSGSCDRSSRR